MTSRDNATPVESTTAPPAVPDESGNGREAGARKFPIVGLGASAGGLAAFEAFFSALPGGSGMAYVLVQHLAPDHRSILGELIGRCTKLPVVEVEEGTVVESDHVYIIPPNHDMALLDGVLHLLAPAAPRGQRLPIDFFFRSLAQDRRDQAVGIVLAGTGNDGTQGIRAIKEEGGMVMAQSPESTQFDGMPRSAIATGLADFVLAPDDMPAQLTAFADQAFGRPAGSKGLAGTMSEAALGRIFVLIRGQTSHDFSGYKPNTIVRRIQRRMALHRIESADDYVQYLRTNPSELDALFRDLLIGVTRFFRDPNAMKALEEEAIARLLSSKPPGASIRVWVPGCSTGEEAYSIAILLQERMDALKTSFKLMVFATDVDTASLDRARAGVYPASIAADVSPERLARYFSEEPGGDSFRVNKLIREILVFSAQDVIKDPPFSRLDLISCRNLLIYMGPELHDKLIPLFHYALNPGGLLFLGTSESIGRHTELFSPVNRTAKVYLRSTEDAPRRLSLGRFFPPVPGNAAVPRRSGTPPGRGGASLREITEQALLLQYASVGALVDSRGDILYLHGRTGRYLEPSPGEAELNILRMAREGLRPALTSVLHKAVTTGAPAFAAGLRVRTNGEQSLVDLAIRPVAPAANEEPLFVVIFEQPATRSAPVDVPTHGTPAPAGAAPADPAEEAEPTRALVNELRRALRDKEEYLQSATGQLEVFNAELKSVNRELQSINEEMQSTNEELETSKEELQSVNEELATVNAELQGKIADLSRANNDMNNLLAGTGVGTIFVDHDLRIQRFTPDVTQVINLIATDVGRPVSHIASNLPDYARLAEDVQQVLDTLVPSEIEVRTRLGRWFILRIRPYRTLDNVIDGAVITFFDITDMKAAREVLHESAMLRRLAALMTDSRDAILVQDLAGRILCWNPGATRLYGWSEAEALTMNIRELIPPGRHEAALAAITRLSGSGNIQPYPAERITKDGRTVHVTLTATALIDDTGTPYAMATLERTAG